MKKAFDFLEPREINDPIDFVHLESKYELVLPPVFKLFVSNFKIEQEFRNHYFINGDNEKSQLGIIRFKRDNISLILDNFFDLEKTYIDWNGGGKLEEWRKFEIVRIGLLGEVGGGGLFIGTNEDNLDEIWQLSWDFPELNRKLCDNIFDFCRCLEFSTEFSNLEEMDYKHLFKKWADSNWQIST